MLLHHQIIQSSHRSPDKLLLCLHGILGMGKNWAGIARELSSRRPEWGVVLVDLRLHGASQRFDPPHTLKSCANDLMELIGALSLPTRAVMGHSFGGKVALELTRLPGHTLDQVWVMDSTPESGRSATQVLAVIDSLKRLSMPQPSRGAVVEALMQEGLSRDISLWLAGNLERHGEQYRWRLNFSGIEDLMRDFYASDLWSVVTDPPLHTHVHLVKAERSDVLSDQGAERVKAASSNGRTHLHILPDAGHWLHVENPSGVVELWDRWQ